MRNVYYHAKCVLVLDAWLQEIPSTAPLLDILARLYQSNWLKRLWTHQEGFLAKQIFIQFSDKAMDLDELKLADHNLRMQLKDEGKFLNFNDITSEMLIVQYTFIAPAEKQLWQDNEDTWKAYLPLSVVMAGRRTTKASDETLCLATIFGLPVHEYQEISGKNEEDTVQQRMIHLLKRLKTFRTDIVFNNYERLNIRGWRWAPKSLLDHGNAKLYTIQGHLDGESSIQEEKQIWYMSLHARLQQQSVTTLTSLRVQYPGFLLKFEHANLSLGCRDRACAIEWEKPPGPKKYVVVELPPNSVHWVNRYQYAIILETEPKVMEKLYMCAVGLVIQRQDKSDDRTAYGFEHLSIGEARLRDNLPLRIDVVKAQLLSKDEVYWDVS